MVGSSCRISRFPGNERRLGAWSLPLPPPRGISLSLGGEGRRKVETHSFQLLGDDEIIINRIWIQLVETCVRDV